MEDILVKNIPENKVPFFLELVHNLGFVTEKKVEKKKLTPKQKAFVADLKQSLQEVELHLQGKKTLKSADQLLNEL
jgi:hypothetical protein